VNRPVEEWTTPRQNWEFTLHEGHDFGRTNNIEARLLFVGGELVLMFEENDGIAKLVRAQEHGLDVELHHILTFT
jgi:hypothetical protein